MRACACGGTFDEGYSKLRKAYVPGLIRDGDWFSDQIMLKQA